MPNEKKDFPPSMAGEAEGGGCVSSQESPDGFRGFGFYANHFPLFSNLYQPLACPPFRTVLAPEERSLFNARCSWTTAIVLLERGLRGSFSLTDLGFVRL